jgi:hypothetical protein
MALIRREDLEAGRVDLSDVVDPAARPLPPVSPGAVLRAEFLEPLGKEKGAKKKEEKGVRNLLQRSGRKRWQDTSVPTFR